MLKNISQIECKVGDKLYHLSCDIDAPLEHVKEALFQFQKYIGHVEDQYKEQLAAKAAESAAEVKEEPKPQ